MSSVTSSPAPSPLHPSSPPRERGAGAGAAEGEEVLMYCFMERRGADMLEPGYLHQRYQGRVEYACALDGCTKVAAYGVRIPVDARGIASLREADPAPVEELFRELSRLRRYHPLRV